MASKCVDFGAALRGNACGPDCTVISWRSRKQSGACLDMGAYCHLIGVIMMAYAIAPGYCYWSRRRAGSGGKNFAARTVAVAVGFNDKTRCSLQHRLPVPAIDDQTFLAAFEIMFAQLWETAPPCIPFKVSVCLFGLVGYGRAGGRFTGRDKRPHAAASLGEN